MTGRKKPSTISFWASVYVDAARLQIEDVLRHDLRDGRAVGAAHVVGGDLEIRDRVGARLAAEDEVAVLLVGVGLLRALVDLDQP